MTLTLDFNAEEEARLHEAAKKGQEVGDYLLTLVSRDLRSPAQKYAELNKEFAGVSLAEALDGYIGTADSSTANGGKPSNAARNSEKEFGKIMDEKRRQGHI